MHEAGWKLPAEYMHTAAGTDQTADSQNSTDVWLASLQPPASRTPKKPSFEDALRFGHWP